MNDYEPFYHFSPTPAMMDFKLKLIKATDSLSNDLSKTNPLELRISDYNRRYLQQKIQRLDEVLSVYADILGSVTCQSPKPFKDFVFIEYGGGTGFLSMLAKKMGIGTVIYNDLYDVSCEDARTIGEFLGCRAEHYVQGDIDSLVKFCREHQLKADAIASYDVIEHIYDVDAFCKELHFITNEGAEMMHASGGSMFFYPAVKRSVINQIECETRDREEQWGHKKMDLLLSYANGREKIIREYSPTLSENEIKQMVKNTRGLRWDDIQACVDRYKVSGRFPKVIEHPTNTCDPYTGNWQEHLMNPYYIQEAFCLNGFDAKVLPRYWNYQGGFLRKNILKLMNRIIGKSGTHTGLHLCPYIAYYSRYNGKIMNGIHKQHRYKYRRLFIWYIAMVLYEVYSRLPHTARITPSRTSPSGYGESCRRPSF